MSLDLSPGTPVSHLVDEEDLARDALDRRVAPSCLVRYVPIPFANGRSLFERLAERECEAIAQVVAGRPIELITDDLVISVRTVEVRRARVFEKIKVGSAVARANLLRLPGHS